MRVLICGDRHWSDEDLIERAVAALPDGSVVIEGDAPGADRIAGAAAAARGLEVLVFPADWKLMGRSAGPQRNRQMLVEGKPDVVWAFHDDLANSKGTANMVMQAKKAGVLVTVIGRNPEKSDGNS